MEQITSWVANQSTASHRNPPHCVEFNIHYSIQNSRPHIPIFTQINLVHVFPYHFLKIQFKITLPSTPRSSKWSLFTQVSPPSPCMHLSCLPHFHMDRPCLNLGLIKRRFDKLRLLNSSLCSLLHPPVTFFLLNPRIFLSTCSQISSSYIPLSI
jgi:hypothetical protein